MASTYEEIMSKSRELASGGDMEGAKRLATIALARRDPRKARAEAARAGTLQASPENLATARDFDSRARSEMTSTPRLLAENVFGDNDPTRQNAGEMIGSLLNKGGEGMTFGLVGDEASAGVESLLPGVNYEDRLKHYRGQEEVFERDHGGLALGAEMGGALLGALGPLGAIGTLGKGAGLGARMLASAGTGAGMGGTYGFMEGEGLEDRRKQGLTGAAVGGAVGAAIPVVGAGVQKAADSVARRRAIADAVRGAPTTDQLRSAGQAAYQSIDDAGVQVKPQAFEGARQKIVDALRQNTGFDELPGPGSLTPNTARVSQIMDDASKRMAAEPTAALPFKSLDQMRRQAGAAAGNVTNRTDQQAGMTVIEGLDDFVRGLGADDVVAGDVKALQTALPKARELWTRMSKSQLIDDAMSQEGNYLSGGASAVRNQFARILRNPKTARSFSEAERKMMQKVVSGSIPQQIVNYLGSGLGMTAQILGGGAAGLAGGPAGGILGTIAGTATAAGSRKLSEAMTRNGAETVRKLVASGGMEKLPVASDASRKFIEALLRRGTAATQQ